MSNSDPFRLAMQVFVAGTGLLVAAILGLLGGSLAPLVRFDGREVLVVPLMLGFYVTTGILFTFAAMAAAEISGATSGQRGIEAADSGTERGRIAIALAWTAVGAAVGGRLVFGVPDWLSTTLPLVALFGAAVAFVLAGDAVSIRGLDVALWSAGGTIYLFVVPAALYPALEFAGLMLAAVVGAASFLVARRWVRGGAPVDRRVSVAFVLVFALVAGGAMAYDLSGPRPTVSLDHESTVNLFDATMRTYSYSDVIEERATISVGTVTVRNEFGFARTTDLTSFDACLYGEDGAERKTAFALASVADGDDWIRSEDEVRLPGESRHRYPLFVLFEDRVSRVPAEIRDLGTVPVRQAERCPETTDGSALVLVPDGEP